MSTNCPTLGRRDGDDVMELPVGADLEDYRPFAKAFWRAMVARDEIAIRYSFPEDYVLSASDLADVERPIAGLIAEFMNIAATAAGAEVPRASADMFRLDVSRMKHLVDDENSLLITINFATLFGPRPEPVDRPRPVAAERKP